jgi:hypothetical protein
MIKPEFFDDPQIAELSAFARLFFIGLWMQADREGRLVDDIRRLKARIFPYDTVDAEALAVELESKDLIRRYHVMTSHDPAVTSNGSTAPRHGYIWIRSFTKHQRPHPHEPASVIPEWTPPVVTRHGKSLQNTAGRTLESKGTRNLVNGTRKADAVSAALLSPFEQLRDLWNASISNPLQQAGAITTTRRTRAKARLTEHPLSEWASVFQRIEASTFCRGENDRGWLASFDWVIKSPDESVKVLEGHYDNRRPGSTNGGAGGRPTYHEPWVCPHVVPCGNQAACQSATALGRAVKAASP